jgi:hypothetical protein
MGDAACTASRHRRPSILRNSSPPTSILQGKFGFELEMRVLVSRRGEPDPSAVDPEEIEESRYADPGVYSLFEGPLFNVVVDHGNGINPFVVERGHHRRANTAIVEIVTHEVDEYTSTRAEAAAPMVEAAAFAGRVANLTNGFTTRQPFQAAPVDRADIYVGQRNFAGESVWQTTDAQIQATYAVKPASLHGLAALGKADGPLQANQFSAMQNQGTALAEAAAKADALIKVLGTLAKSAIGKEGLEAQHLSPQRLADLKGLLTLAGTYLAAGRLDQGTSLDKNMVPLLIRHELTAAHGLLSEDTQALLAHKAVREVIRDALLKQHKRDGGDKLFPGTEGARRRDTNLDTGVTQPTCAQWIEAIFTGGTAPLQAWFGKSKVVAPEEVGPPQDNRPKGVVMEQRAVKTGQDSVDGVPPSGWAALAERYYDMLRALNA